jgi:hypothetical protein
MKRFIEGENRSQSTLFPERLDDYIAEDNPVRAIEVFVDELDLDQLGFALSSLLNSNTACRKLESEAARTLFALMAGPDVRLLSEP